MIILFFMIIIILTIIIKNIHFDKPTASHKPGKRDQDYVKKLDSWQPDDNIDSKPSHKELATTKETQKKPAEPIGIKSYQKKHRDLLEKGTIIEQKYLSYGNRMVHYKLIEQDRNGQTSYLITYELANDATNNQQWGAVIADYLLVTINDEKYLPRLVNYTKQHGLLLELSPQGTARYKVFLKRPTIDNYFKRQRQLSGLRGIKSVDSDILIYPAIIPIDRLYQNMWHLTAIEAHSAWTENNVCLNVKIAVFDTGVMSSHPDLADNLDLENSYSFITKDLSTEIQDNHGHGTHIAGIIGGIGDNRKGVAGLCWQTKLVSMKIADDDGIGTTSSVIRALEYMMANDQSYRDVKVVNLSYGWFQAPHTSQMEFIETIKKWRNLGKIVVTAAGNHSQDLDKTPYYPASFRLPNIISVEATDPSGQLASFSNYSDTMALMVQAPGQNIISTMCTDCPNYPDNYQGFFGYSSIEGTSMSSAIVAGSIALYWSKYRERHWLGIFDDLLSSSLKGSLKDSTRAGGKLNLRALFQMAAGLGAEGHITIETPKKMAAKDEPVTFKVNSSMVNSQKTEFIADYRVKGWSESQEASFNWQSGTPGEHVFYAKGRDHQGNTLISTPVFIEIKNQQPECQITLLSSRDSFLAGEKIDIGIDATDPDGKIVDYTLIMGDKGFEIETDSIDNSRFDIAILELGQRDIYVTVKDNEGGVVDSNKLTITIVNEMPEWSLKKIPNFSYLGTPIPTELVGSGANIPQGLTMELWENDEKVASKSLDEANIIEFIPKDIGLTILKAVVRDEADYAYTTPTIATFVIRDLATPYKGTEPDAHHRLWFEDESFIAPSSKYYNIKNSDTPDSYQVCTVKSGEQILKGLSLAVNSPELCSLYCQIIAPLTYPDKIQTTCEIAAREINRVIFD